MPNIAEKRLPYTGVFQAAIICGTIAFVIAVVCLTTVAETKSGVEALHLLEKAGVLSNIFQEEQACVSNKNAEARSNS